MDPMAAERGLMRKPRGRGACLLAPRRPSRYLQRLYGRLLPCAEHHHLPERLQLSGEPLQRGGHCCPSCRHVSTNRRHVGLGRGAA